MSFYAYIHCKPNGTPFYVGKGSIERVKLKKRKHNKWHSNILKKYGEENILVGSMECSSEEISFQLEMGLIKRIRAMGLNVVNQTKGGEGRLGGFVCNETRRKISQNMRGKRNFLGKTHSSESRKKIGLSQIGNKWNLGRKLSDGHKQKVSLALKGRSFTEESKHKISQKLKGNKNSLGMKWITNGHKNKRLKPGAEVPDGWSFGKIYRTAK